MKTETVGRVGEFEKSAFGLMERAAREFDDKAIRAIKIGEELSEEPEACYVTEEYSSSIGTMGQ